MLAVLREVLSCECLGLPVGCVKLLQGGEELIAELSAKVESSGWLALPCGSRL